jgi:HK97 family phage prohead protease
MPIPKPHAGESRSDFMGRCMSAVADEFDSQEQRVAVCMNTWRRHRGGKIGTREDIVGLAKDGLTGDAPMIRKAGVADGIEAGEGRTLSFIISTNAVDRDNDVIDQNGWHLDTYKQNPVVLWAHDYTQLPLGRSTDIGVKDGRLKATTEFADHAFADTVYRMLKGGFLRATSVGFVPKLFAENKDRGGLDIIEQDLLEFSIVPVPANPEALIEARAAGIDVEPIRRWAEGTLALFKATSTTKVVEPVIDAAADLDVSEFDFVFDLDGDPDPVRWNRALSKAFDVDEAPAEPSTQTYQWASRFLSTPVKDLYETSLTIGGARMGAFLSALEDDLTAQFTVASLRNLHGSSESPPAYDTIQLNSKTSRDFLIEGIRFFTPVVDGGFKMVLKVQPTWAGLHYSAFVSRETAAQVNSFFRVVEARAAQLKFLKGEAFSLSGEFLARGGETWDDLFLPPVNRQPLQRTVTLVKDQGAAMDPRGQILMGPPGTGKTLAGRVMMNDATDATFIWLSARDFYRAGVFGGFTMAFDLAVDNAPSIVFIEDVDAWLSETAVDLLKSELDGIKQKRGIVTVLTTNHPEDLPEALIDRPGRFHDVLRLDLPTELIRAEMLAKWAPDAPPGLVASLAKETLGFSGAHLRELVRFAEVLRAQDGVDISAALTTALGKIRQQRATIDAARAESRRRYRPVKQFKVTQMRKDLGTCTRCGKTDNLDSNGLCAVCGMTQQGGKGDLVSLAKQGRVLSAANEKRLLSAKTLLEDVLAQLATATEVGDDGQPPPATAKAADIVIELDDDLDVDDDDVDVDPSVWQAALRDGLASVMSDIGDTVRHETEAALRRARGRVD